ncbi:Mfa1 family fimbria major subunit [Phocaeicola salanitronis]|uniref:Mfa1 family fimbria major subunit n=1 Tax=Phocaeicola salanitronis TaxID=376805 RepID=UPI0023F77676|nr:Mfa1 family fimbria major subunit [Phocaeicola salanitronis]
MKLNKYFMMGAMGLSLVACSDNLDENGQSANGTNPNEGTTYAALKINFESASSRVGELPVDGDEDGQTYVTDAEGNEAAVKDVRIVVVDENNNVEYNQVVTAQKNDDNADVYIFQIQPGEKTFYAVINGNALSLNDELADWDGGELTLNKKASDLCGYDESATAGNGFLMSSVAPVEATIQDDIDEATVKAGTANNVTITVDRVVAKVTMQMDDEINMDNQTATLKNLTCQIGNADNLRFAESAYTTAGTYLMAKDESGHRTTPYYTYTLDASSATGFDQSQLLSGTAQPIYTDGTASQTSARFYCLENTHASDNYLQSNTTFVRVKAEMIPNSALTFAYAEGAVSVSEKADMPTELETFYVITAAPDQSYNGSYVFESDLAAIYDDVVVDGSASDNAGKATEVRKALADDGYAFSEAYTGGAGYYNIWVNDMKDAEGSYLNIAPVFRNDWYDLTITGIKLPGDPNPDIDPEEPIHPNTNVAVTLSIRDWNKVTHNVDLQ